MIFLSALGGARGDFLVGGIVVLLIIIRCGSLKTGALILLPLLLFSLSYLDISADDFLIIKRFSVIGDGNFGLRDVLLLQSIELLSEEIKCLAMGCGLNYFQIYYGYGYGMYPHNIFVVERAMHNIGRDTAPASKDDVSKLDKFLKADD
jgi:hypothetical protein